MTFRALVATGATLATTATATAHAAEYGSRTMREGTSGGDVSQLQRYLTRAGFHTAVDGAFGPRTARSVRGFEREHGRPVNGVVPPHDARAVKAAASAQEAEQVEAGRAYIRNGLAVAPASAPRAVKAVMAAGNEIAKKPYKYGGGHGSWSDSG